MKRENTQAAAQESQGMTRRGFMGAALAGTMGMAATAQGIDATADDMYDWFMAHPEWYGPKDPAVTRVNAEKSGETIDWLQEQGVPFEETVAPQFGYTELPVIHQVDGRGPEMMRVLGEVAASAGVTTLTDTPATALVADAEGRVVGVRANEEMEYENPLGHRAILRKQNEQGSPVVLLLPTTPELEAVLATRPLEWAKADTVEEVAHMVGLDGRR